jgi:hypothetical protein
MKHIKKKYLFQQKLTDETEKKVNEKGQLVSGTSKNLVKKAKDLDLFIQTVDLNVHDIQVDRVQY